MKEGTKKALKYALSLGVAAVLLYFSFRGVKWEDFVNGLRECRLGFVLLSMAASIAAFWLRGVRWRQLLLPIDPSISRLTSFNAINIGYIANFVFPRIGEFVRCGVITNRSLANHSETPATYDKVLGTVVLERAWDVLTMLIFAAALLIFRWDKFGTFVVEKMWNPMAERLNFSLWWLVAGILVLCVAAVVVIVKLRHRSKVCGKICDICRGILQGFSTAFRMEAKWKFFLNTLLIWTMYWLMAVFTMSAIPSLGDLNMVDALFLMIAGSFGWMVPVPGGFGSFHFIVSLALSTIYGIPFELGIIFATLSHESQAITMALCGGISYFYETFKK